MYVNIQCISNKLERLEILLQEHQTEIICLAEHWLKYDSLKTVVINNYKLTSQYCRTTYAAAGGVCIFSRIESKFEKFDLSVNINVERDIEACAIINKDLKVIVLVVYRSPVGNFDTFLQHLEQLLLECEHLNYKIFLCGDFNVNFCGTSKELASLLDICKQFNLQQSVFTPTRITSQSSTCIDNIFINMPNQLINTKVFEPHLGDHCAIHLAINRTIDRETVTRSFRDISFKSLSSLGDGLSLVNWDLLICQISACDAFTAFLDQFTYCFDSNCKIKYQKMSANRSRLRWFNEDLKRMRNYLSVLHTIFIASKTEYSEKIYKKYKTEYAQQIKLAKKQVNVKFLNNSANKSKAAWQVIKSNLNLDPKTDKSSPITADEFNKHFVNVPKAVLDAISTSYPFEPYLTKAKSSKNSFFLRPTNEVEVYNIIHSLKDSATEDAFGLTAKVVKFVAPIIVEPLTYVINKCFVEGYFPEQLKISKILPLHKKGSSSDAGNFRPIAIIPVLAKIFEKILKERLVAFFETMIYFAKSSMDFEKSYPL